MVLAAGGGGSRPGSRGGLGRHGCGLPSARRRHEMLQFRCPKAVIFGLPMTTRSSPSDFDITAIHIAIISTLKNAENGNMSNPVFTAPFAKNWFERSDLY